MSRYTARALPFCRISHMIHGPCGPLNPSCPCMQDGLCIKNYPKAFLSATRVRDGGYPEYRRRESNPLRTAKRGLLDTRSVVPHNLGLLEKFDCHLHVEVCTSIKAVKYLYKYTYKGPDRACLDRSVDEVSQFLDSRYCGAPEAAWRLFGFPLQGRSHHVERLPIRLPLEKTVTFRSGSLIRSLRYPDVPRYFVWNSKTFYWTRRAKISKEIVFISLCIHDDTSASTLHTAVELHKCSTDSLLTLAPLAGGKTRHWNGNEPQGASMHSLGIDIMRVVIVVFSVADAISLSLSLSILRRRGYGFCLCGCCRCSCGCCP